jgi:hypothetical protein
MSENNKEEADEGEIQSDSGHSGSEDDAELDKATPNSQGIHHSKSTIKHYSSVFNNDF